jgi:hypothetical protein
MKCRAKEFVFVEADSEADAISKAEKGEYTRATSQLEFDGYRNKDTWIAEELVGRINSVSVSTGETVITDYDDISRV